MKEVGNLYSVCLGYEVIGKRGKIVGSTMFHTLLPANSPEEALGRAMANAENDESWEDGMSLTHHDVAEITQEIMAIHYDPTFKQINVNKQVVN